MSADFAISLLRRGDNGAELLSILDSIADQENAAEHYTEISAPTADQVQF